jgi:hypothetical protein
MFFRKISEGICYSKEGNNLLEQAHGCEYQWVAQITKLVNRVTFYNINECPQSVFLQWVISIHSAKRQKNQFHLISTLRLFHVP